MKSADIAALLVAGSRQQGNGNTDLGWHTGVVQSWDEQTGLNSIEINGNTFDNLSVLSAGSVVPFQAGDTVALMRVQSQYFILGKIRAAGAGAAERIVSAKKDLPLVVSGALTWGDLPSSYGPEVSVYIGSGRRALVLHSSGIYCSQAYGVQGVQVSGASTLAVSTAVRNAFLRNTAAPEVWTMSTCVSLITAADGLEQGQNTFTCKYNVELFGTGTGAYFGNRSLTVIPF